MYCLSFGPYYLWLISTFIARGIILSMSRVSAARPRELVIPSRMRWTLYYFIPSMITYLCYTSNFIRVNDRKVAILKNVTISKFKIFQHIFVRIWTSCRNSSKKTYITFRFSFRIPDKTAKIYWIYKSKVGHLLPQVLTWPKI